jgi:hypothetical protein
MFSKITITFNEEFTVGKTLTIDASNGGLDTIMLSNFVTLRIGLYQVTSNIRILEDEDYVVGASTAQNFRTAFLLDYPGLYSVVRTANVLVIEALIDSIIFNSGSSTGDADFVIENFASDPFTLTSITTSTASLNPCANVKVSILFSEAPTKVTLPFLINDNEDNPVEFDWPRGTTFNLDAELTPEQKVIRSNVRVPPLLNSEGEISIIQTPNGGTLSAAILNSTILVVEFSLDGINWQSSNVFSGLEAGEYTLRIRDQFGCVKQRTNIIVTEVGELNGNQPFFYISKSNSIRYANRIIFGESANYKNDENTLSCEADVEVPYMEIQPFQSADVVTTQFKSNYSENLANVVLANGSEVSIPVIQKTSNIGLKDKRDARKFNLGGGKIGIYFTSGNKYNYDTNAVESTYELNGRLPAFAKAGNYIFFDLNWYLISGVLYVEEKNADVIEVIGVYEGSDVATIVSCVYNLFNYEVYEFAIDMVDYLNEQIRVRINANDTVFQDLVFLSERIEIKVRHEKTVEVLYYNEENTDIFYQTGIRNKIRMFLNRKNSIVEAENELHKMDNSTIVLSGKQIEGDEFEFEPVSKEIMRKLCQALAHKFLFIDGQQYVLDGSPDVEGPIERSNLHVVKAKLLKSGEPFRNNGNEFGFDTTNIDIPGLIETEDGFVKY